MMRKNALEFSVVVDLQLLWALDHVQPSNVDLCPPVCLY
jgi:hypothetical protein